MLKLQKILGNICFSEQIFYRKQSLGAPVKCGQPLVSWHVFKKWPWVSHRLAPSVRAFISGLIGRSRNHNGISISEDSKCKFFLIFQTLFSAVNQVSKLEKCWRIFLELNCQIVCPSLKKKGNFSFQYVYFLHKTSH